MDKVPLLLDVRPPTPIEVTDGAVGSMIPVPEENPTILDIPSTRFGFGGFGMAKGEALVRFSSAGGPLDTSPGVGFGFERRLSIESPPQGRGEQVGNGTETLGISPRRTVLLSSPCRGYILGEEAYTLNPSGESAGAHLRIVGRAHADISQFQDLQGSEAAGPAIENFQRAYSPTNHSQKGLLGSHMNLDFLGKKLEMQNYRPDCLTDEEEVDKQEDQQKSTYKDDLDGDDNDDRGRKEGVLGGKNGALKSQKKQDRSKPEFTMPKQLPSSTKVYKQSGTIKVDDHDFGTEAPRARKRSKTALPPGPRQEGLKICLGEEIIDFEDYIPVCIVYDDFGRKIMGYRLDQF